MHYLQYLHLWQLHVISLVKDFINFENLFSYQIKIVKFINFKYVLENLLVNNIL